MLLTKKQSEFIRNKSRFLLYGGANGGGKTFGSCAKAVDLVIRSFGNQEKIKILFIRTTMGEINQSGGLWDTTVSLLDRYLNQKYFTVLSSIKRINFINGSRIDFSEMANPRSLAKKEGAEFHYIFIDQAENFNFKQIQRLWERNRTSSASFKNKLQFICTLNPNPDSPICKDLIIPFCDEKGYPIKQKSSAKKFFKFGDNGFDVTDKKVDDAQVEYSFIPAFVDDNPYMAEYSAQLESLPLVDRERKKYGNFKIREGAGLVFNKDIITFHNKKESSWYVRAWDFGATVSGDYTVGTKGFLEKGVFYIDDIVFFKLGVGERDNKILSVATADTTTTLQVLEKEGGSGGASQVFNLKEILRRFRTDVVLPKGNKLIRSKTLQHFWQNQKVSFNKDIKQLDIIINQFNSFTGVNKNEEDDIVDASSHCINYILEHRMGSSGYSTFVSLDNIRKQYY